MTSASRDRHQSIRVADLMRTAVTTVERPAHLAAAAYLMKHGGASALVVISDEHERAPIGIITDADIADAVAEGRSLDEARISDLVDRAPVVTGPDTPISVAAATLLSAQLRQLPVVDQGHLVGILDISDACRGLLPVPAKAG